MKKNKWYLNCLLYTSLTFAYDKATEGNSSYYTKASEMIKAFRFEEPDAAVVGQLQEPEPSYVDDKVTNTVRLYDNKYKVQIPISWSR